eukprot:TRINITY_DN7211_c0_g1_i1.p1 TRINITY_DN7211_c0_g1~~TRINITY_DN7211_c0_g1_i1.p1  ORF type:complete len:276 (+),score=27.60 TRINITY_DN7211_c0_g1_i1:58-885(+)
MLFVWSLILLFASTQSQDPGSKLEGVTELTVSNWEAEMKKSAHFLVEFYAPWCGWCKKLVPLMAQLGELSNEDVIVAKFDATQPDGQTLKARYGVRGFPTIVLIKAGDRDVPVRFSGARTLDGIVEFVFDHTAVRMLAGSGPSTAEPVVTPTAFDPAPLPDDHVEGTVLELDVENFEATVMDESRDVFVKFYAPWCGHCQRMAPTWDALAAAEPEVLVVKLDASKYNILAGKFGVRGFPTLRWFGRKSKTIENVFRGSRDLPSLQTFIRAQKSAS